MNQENILSITVQVASFQSPNFLLIQMPVLGGHLCNAAMATL